MNKKECKIKIIVFWAVLLSCCSCQRENMSIISDDNRVITIQQGDKSGIEYLLFISLGHDGKNCPGCVLSNGQWFHVDCQGAGTACQTSAAVIMHPTNTTFAAITTDTFGLTNLNFFHMPARSLSYDDGDYHHNYLNIPAQTLFRSNTSLQFTFTGLFFSSTPAYSNN